MPEPIDAWWTRRAASTGRAVPYPVGTYREEWHRYPVLVRQYHPDLNRGIVLSQVPLSADVWLQWQCDAGHRFIATPEEQRMRPGSGQRRRSTWCPECLRLAEGKAGRLVAREPPPPRATPKRRRLVCELTPDLPPGEAFVSRCAPTVASAAEPALREALAARLEFDPAPTAVKLRQPFFQHTEAWPDVLLSDLRVAIEYDTAGRYGLEHTGRREAADQRKNRLLANVGWTVIRVRIAPLPALSPHDLVASGLSATLVDRVVDRLRDLRGPLLVDAWLR